MKTALVIGLLTLAAAAASFAQDPGFLQPVQPRPAAPAPTAPSGGGDEVRSAGLINTMDQLDNSTPLQPDYIVSYRVVEDNGEPLRLRVQATGELQVPHAGLMRAAGRTCREVAFAAKAELEKKYYQKATVIVAIDVIPQVQRPNGPGIMPDSETFTVFGQVARQGKYELGFTEDLTISQAILRAGGPAQFANLKKVKLIRKTPRGNKAVQVDVQQIMERGALEYDIFIRNNDVLIIPEKVASF